MIYLKSQKVTYLVRNYSYGRELACPMTWPKTDNVGANMKLKFLLTSISALSIIGFAIKAEALETLLL